MEMSPATRALAIALAFETVTGTRPMVTIDENGSRVITMQDGNRRYLASLMESALTPGGPPKEIRFVGIGEAIAPAVLKRAVPIALGCVALGILVGVMLR